MTLAVRLSVKTMYLFYFWVSIKIVDQFRVENLNFIFMISCFLDLAFWNLVFHVSRGFHSSLHLQHRERYRSWKRFKPSSLGIMQHRPSLFSNLAVLCWSCLWPDFWLFFSCHLCYIRCYCLNSEAATISNFICGNCKRFDCKRHRFAWNNDEFQPEH